MAPLNSMNLFPNFRCPPLKFSISTVLTAPLSESLLIVGTQIRWQGTIMFHLDMATITADLHNGSSWFCQPSCQVHVQNHHMVTHMWHHILPQNASSIRLKQNHCHIVKPQMESTNPPRICQVSLLGWTSMWTVGSSPQLFSPPALPKTGCAS